MAVRGSRGQAEIWSAGSERHVTALEKAAPSVQTFKRGRTRQEHATSADGHVHPGNHRRTGAPHPHRQTRPRTRSQPPALPSARQQAPARHGGSALTIFTPLRRHPGPPTTFRASVDPDRPFAALVTYSELREEVDAEQVTSRSRDSSDRLAAPAGRAAGFGRRMGGPATSYRGEEVRHDRTTAGHADRPSARRRHRSDPRSAITCTYRSSTLSATTWARACWPA